MEHPVFAERWPVLLHLSLWWKLERREQLLVCTSSARYFFIHRPRMIIIVHARLVVPTSCRVVRLTHGRYRNTRIPALFFCCFARGIVLRAAGFSVSRQRPTCSAVAYLYGGTAPYGRAGRLRQMGRAAGQNQTEMIKWRNGSSARARV